MPVTATKPYPSDPTSAGSSDTQQKILVAARQEFVAKGLAGARMKSIAEAAGVNKALVHYYFRSKELLYEAALQDIIARFWGSARQALSSTDKIRDVRQMIESIVRAYLEVMNGNPEFPRMFMREMADGGRYLPEVMRSILSAFGDVPRQVIAVLRDGMRRGTVKRVEPVHIVINILGMCAATFFTRPVVAALSTSLPGIESPDTDQFIEQRIQAITLMACDGLLQGEES